MRITRLHLDRYGHLSDLALAFPPESGLHVVLGPNEAGKSTALAAVADALFGFPHITPYAFLHPTRDLRVAIGLRGEDGRERLFARIKRNQNDLLDADGAPVAESALASLLGGVSRERFRRVFGLDAASLRAGGQAILAGRGDLGESIVQAHTGLTGLRALADRLGEEAGRLFGTRHGKRAFHVAVDAHKAAREELEARIVPPAAFARARADHDRLVAERDAAAAEARALQAERARLARIDATAPARAALARDLPELAALGDVPALPPDAEAQMRDARAASGRAADDLHRERDAAAELRAELAALVIDPALLAEAEAIDALAADRSRIQAAEREREPQRTVEAQAAQGLQDAAQRLGRADDPHSLLARIPNALARDAVARAASAHDKLATRRQDAEAATDAAARAVTLAAAQVAALPDPPPFAELRAAITAARTEGRLDAERDEAARALEAAREALATALAGLPLWHGTADALAAVPLPLAPRLAGAADALRAAEAGLRARSDALARRETTLAQIAAELAGHLAGGEVPTETAIGAARERRDRAWHLLRRQHIEGGAAPSPEELAGIGEAGALPAAFETLLRAADTLADRRAGDLARVVAYDHARTRDVQERALRVQDAAAEAAAAVALDAARADWAALWRPAGIAPLDPDSMRDWLRQRDEVLGKRAEVQAAERRLAALAARHEAAWAPLAALLPEEAAAAGDRLAALLKTADRLCAEREAAHAALATARKDLATAEAEAGKQRAQMEKAETTLAGWRETWRATVASIGLAPDAPVEGAKLALQLWADIDLKAQTWRAARDRIEQMTDAVRADAEAVAALVARIAPDLAAADPHQAARSLATRLAEARKAATRRRDVEQLAQKSATRIAALETQHRAAETALTALRRLAGAADDAALQEAIRRAAAHATLTQRIREREAELHRLGQGKSRAELDAEAGGIDADALHARVVEIDDRLKAIAAESDARSGQLALLRTELAAMERGHDAADAAQAMRDALAEAEDVAARYVRVRLAQTLLRAGIEQFRRQSQGPLLARAGALFAQLTEGRYARLDVDADDKGEPVVAALRGDGSVCPVERLSDGTRDQLYLALRLAAIEGEAGSAETLPLIADDLLVNFDDRRARAALRVLAGTGRRTQTILFTHHAHIAAMAEDGIAPVLRLPAVATAAAA